MISRGIVIVLAFLCGYSFADTCGTEILLPQKCKEIISGKGKPLAVCVADVNGDSTEDYVVALQLDSVPQNEESDENDRELIVITKKGDNYAIAAKSKKAIMCSTCGGVMGDPFERLEAGKKWFAISHSGGSRERWNCTYKFGYSRRDKNWQLIQVTNASVDTQDESDNGETTIHKPPKNFGLIPFEEFDPDDYLGKGKK